MNRRILLTLLCALPCALFSQTYTFNRQSIVRFDDEHKSHTDTWQSPLTVEVQKKFVIMRRPPNGAGERPMVDTMYIKKTSNEKRDKRVNFNKLTMKDGRILVIYGDDYITMSTKETKDHKRKEYVFYNQAAE